MPGEARVELSYHSSRAGQVPMPFALQCGWWCFFSFPLFLISFSFFFPVVFF